MLDRISLWSHLVLDFCLLEDFKLHFQFHYLWLVCLYFLFLSSSVLESCFVQFFQVIQYSRLRSLHFCSVSCNFFFFISNFTDLNPLLFSWWFWLKVYKFYLLKEPNFSFIYLWYYFLFLYFIYFCSDLYDFFPSSNFGVCFCSSFSSCFRCKVRLFIWDFSCFLRWD